MDIGRAGEVRFGYQPIVRLAGDPAVVCVETLLDMADPGRYVSGLTTEGMYDLFCAGADDSAQITTLDVSINASPSLIVAYFTEIVEICSRRPNLIVEITEEDGLDQAILDRLLSAGVRVALDDFGAGAPRFDVVTHPCVEGVKLDRSWVCAATEHRSTWHVLAAVVGSLADQGKTITAEGIETFQAAEAMREAGVHRGQGFLWGAKTSLAA